MNDERVKRSPVSLIDFEDVYLSYNGKVLFNDLSFKVGKGEKVILAGRSGIGKSTLFSLILGFVTPERGMVFFDGEPVDEKNVWQIRRRVAFIDQDVSIGRGRVNEWFDFVLSLKANSSLRRDERGLRESFEYFELEGDILEKEINELSGGERQRIAVVTSIILGRKVFLLDEVTASLDGHMKEKLAWFFCSRSDWTVVVISHDSVWLENPNVKVFDLEGKRWKQ